MSWPRTSNLNLPLPEGIEKFCGLRTSKKYLPPMPGVVFEALTDDEIASIHAYIKHLGVAGKRASMNLPPTQKPKGPFIVFVPQVEK